MPSRQWKQLFLRYFCAHSMRSLLCFSVNIGVLIGRLFWYPLEFKYRPTDRYEISTPWECNLLDIPLREIEESLLMYCPIALAALTSTLLFRPFPHLCSNVLFFLSVYWHCNELYVWEGLSIYLILEHNVCLGSKNTYFLVILRKRRHFREYISKRHKWKHIYNRTRNKP